MSRTKSTPKKEKKRPYIAGVAAFRFYPNPDWSTKEAHQRFNEQSTISEEISIDTVLFEDCISGMQRLPDECIDLVIADPPFGINFNEAESLYNRDNQMIVGGYQEINNEYQEFTESWIYELPRIMKQHASAYVFSGFNNLENVMASARKAELETINHIIWHYQFGVFTRRKFVTSHYHILLLVKDSKNYFFHKVQHYPLDVWPILRKYKRGEKKNQTALPREVVNMCIDFSSKPGDLILDPFIGNGTTAVAAKANFRHFIGYEINANLKDIIEENINSVQLGEEYTPYATRLPSIEELKKKYPRAYKYLRELGEIEIDESEG